MHKEKACLGTSFHIAVIGVEWSKCCMPISAPVHLSNTWVLHSALDYLCNVGVLLQPMYGSIQHMSATSCALVYMHKLVTVCRQLRPYADSQGHVVVEETRNRAAFACTKQSQTRKKLKRVQAATSMLATLEPMLSQVKQVLLAACI